MVEVEVEVCIARPREAVFAYVTDVSRDTTWTSGLVEARALTEGPLAEGSRVERISSFLGRRFGYTILVTGVEPGRAVHMETTAGPFPMTVHYLLDDAPDGTRMRIQTAGDPGGFFRFAGPLLSRMVARQIGHDLQQLKDVLEAEPA